MITFDPYRNLLSMTDTSWEGSGRTLKVVVQTARSFNDLWVVHTSFENGTVLAVQRDDDGVHAFLYIEQAGQQTMPRRYHDPNFGYWPARLITGTQPRVVPCRRVDTQYWTEIPEATPGEFCWENVEGGWLAELCLMVSRAQVLPVTNLTFDAGVWTAEVSGLGPDH